MYKSIKKHVLITVAIAIEAWNISKRRMMKISQTGQNGRNPNILCSVIISSFTGDIDAPARQHIRAHRLLLPRRI